MALAKLAKLAKMDAGDELPTSRCAGRSRMLTVAEGGQQTLPVADTMVAEASRLVQAGSGGRTSLPLGTGWARTP